MASAAVQYAGKYLQFGYELQDRCKKLEHIEGAKKLERKIIAEIKFLKSLRRRGVEIQESHVRSSNLGHYAAVLHATENIPGVAHLLRPFAAPGKPDSLVVDMVAAHGHVWVKVIARKAQALHLVWAGQGQFGERDLLRQADDYLDVVQHHHYNFVKPAVHFAFYNGVTQPMAAALRQRGITVWGAEVAVDNRVQEKLLSVITDDSDTDQSEASDDSHDSEESDSNVDQKKGDRQLEEKREDGELDEKDVGVLGSLRKVCLNEKSDDREPGDGVSCKETVSGIPPLSQRKSQCDNQVKEDSSVDSRCNSIPDQQLPRLKSRGVEDPELKCGDELSVKYTDDSEQTSSDKIPAKYLDDMQQKDLKQKLCNEISTDSLKDVQKKSSDTSSVIHGQSVSSDNSSTSLQHSNIRSNDKSSTSLQHSNIRSNDKSSTSLQHSYIGSNDKSSTSLQHSYIGSSDKSSTSLQHSYIGSSDKSSTSLQQSHIGSSDTSSTSLQHSYIGSSDKSSTSLQQSHIGSSDKSSTSLQQSHIESSDTSSTSLQQSHIGSSDKSSTSLQQSHIGSSDKSSTSLQQSHIGSSDKSSTSLQQSHIGSSDKLSTSLQQSHIGSSDKSSTSLQQSHIGSSDTLSTNDPERSHKESLAGCQGDVHMQCPPLYRELPESRFVVSELLSEFPDYSSLARGSLTARDVASVDRVNLDITTLITLVSNVTHGSWSWVFPENILTLQAAEEREHPAMPYLENFMKGKKLFACETAISDFHTILNTLGGVQERVRAATLLTHISVVKDNPSKRAVTLKKHGRIKDRSKVIFGTGDSIEAVTMTANSGFVRAAEGQGVSFAVYIHPARALTEGKEKTAVSLS